MTTITSTTKNAVLSNGATVVGRVWEVEPYFPYSLDTSPEAAEYITRNTGKTIDVAVWHLRYAEPPVGQYRWRAPRPYTYTGVNDCSDTPNVSQQRYPEESSQDGRPEWGDAVNTWNFTAWGSEKNEDSLFMTVWQPPGTPPAGGWPVFFAIHGGGFGLGAAMMPSNRLHQLAAMGILCVAPNYRLAEFGFWYDQDREGENDYDGASLALQDQRLALQMVQDEISAFGGNPSNVTVGGWSAGGASTLHHFGDPTIQSLMTRGFVSGGGGAEYLRKDPYKNTEGYARKYNRARKAIIAGSTAISSMNTVGGYLSDDIAAHGEFEGIRRGVPPETIMSLFNRGTYLSRGRFVNDTLTAFDSRPHENFYPLHDPVHAPDGGAMASAVAGNLTKPLWLLVANSEAHGLITDFSTVNRDGYARRLNFFDYDEWKAEFPSTAGVSSDSENGRILYGHGVFQYPAWRIAKAMHTTASANCWLSVWALMPDGQTSAGHTADSNFFTGSIEWRVGKTGVEANLTARTLKIMDAAMRTFAAYCSSGVPDSTLAPSAGFDLFATPEEFTLTLYDGSPSEQYKWNIFGENTRTPVIVNAATQVVNEEWFADEMEAYYTRGAS